MENPLRNKIALIGYRAVGKTTVSALLGRRYGAKVVDTDAEIVARAGQDIATIFKERGEKYFRDLEADVMKELLESPEALILSTGGGAPLREETRALLKKRAHVVWLTATVETIAKRMLGDAGTASNRPSLTGGRSAVDEIETVLTMRSPIYGATATIVVSTEEKGAEEIAAEIAALVPTL